MMPHPLLRTKPGMHRTGRLAKRKLLWLWLLLQQVRQCCAACCVDVTVQAAGIQRLAALVVCTCHHLIQLPA